jgi:hypothetical protein
MGKGLAAALLGVLMLAALSWAADDKPQFSKAGLYEIIYELDDTGNITVKKLSLAEAGDKIEAAPGIAFGVCCPEIKIKGQVPQAGFAHPRSDSNARFCGVESAFKLEDSRPQRFYGFIFDQKVTPAPGLYAVTLFRADDGSLLGRQTFTVVAGPKAAPEQAPAKEEKK